MYDQRVFSSVVVTDDFIQPLGVKGNSSLLGLEGNSSLLATVTANLRHPMFLFLREPSYLSLLHRRPPRTQEDRPSRYYEKALVTA